MDNKETKKDSILLKKLDLVFVYTFIFFLGIAIMLIMTTYLNNKVKEFNYEIVSTVQTD